METTCVVRWRCVVRWSARTFVRHVAPAADATLPSRSISCFAFFVALFVAFFVAVALVAAAAGCDGGHVGHVGLVTRCGRASTTFRVLLVTMFPAGIAGSFATSAPAMSGPATL